VVLRFIVVLVAVILVGTSPTWLSLLGGLVGSPGGATQPLLFSPYWVAVPAAVAIGLSWVYEMGAAKSSGLEEMLALGGFELAKQSTAAGERHADWGPKGDSAGLAGTTTSVWKRLETDFREILEFGADLDAQWKRTSVFADATETWSLSGVYEEQRTVKKFNDLAATAGRMLVEWPGYTPPLSASTTKQSVALDRWLCVLRDREIKTEIWAHGQMAEAGVVTGHVHGGVIREVIEASIELCVQLTLEESLEDRSNSTGESLGVRLALPGKG
jgi:hypothetical protein